MSRVKLTIAQVREGVRLALMAIAANKFLSSMTIFGVTIGVGAVILVNTIMDGFQAYLLSSIEKIGSNVMYISKGDENTDFDALTEEQRRRKDITMDEAYAIREMCPLVKAVSPEKQAYDNIARYGDRTVRNPDDFRGCWPELAVVTNRDCEYGRFIDENDLQRAARVCVIGPEVADALFDSRADAVDRTIRVNGFEFRVVGVQEQIDDFFEISENDYIYIPMTTFDRLYPDVKSTILMVSAVSRDQFPDALDQVVNALRRVRGLRSEDENNFSVETQVKFEEQVTRITANIKLGAVAVAIVGLLVGVIGVMNIMLVSVTQRTREIGVRKAVGARRANILFQFLVEAATLTGVGGAVGIVVGALVGLIVTSSLDWAYYLSPLWAAIGLAMSAGTGLAAGVYPAWRASRVDPIVALRYE
ncbi:MAG: ABC transporter permease [candidate division Zixibacteria bacterium]|jgi:putative ABC transport system permease protein|nr:ABC transporter permease [candidate division Zixibacteria bacterium]